LNPTCVPEADHEFVFQRNQRVSTTKRPDPFESSQVYPNLSAMLA